MYTEMWRVLSWWLAVKVSSYMSESLLTVTLLMSTFLSTVSGYWVLNLVSFTKIISLIVCKKMNTFPISSFCLLLLLVLFLIVSFFSFYSSFWLVYSFSRLIFFLSFRWILTCYYFGFYILILKSVDYSLVLLSLHLTLLYNLLSSSHHDHSFALSENLPLSYNLTLSWTSAFRELFYFRIKCLLSSRYKLYWHGNSSVNINAWVCHGAPQNRLAATLGCDDLPLLMGRLPTYF